MQFSEQETPAVGEVRVKVKLTNGSDQFLADSGKLDRSQIRTCEVNAMVDTGAVRSVITESVAQELGVPCDRIRTVAFADGRKESVSLAGPLGFEIQGRYT